MPGQIPITRYPALSGGRRRLELQVLLLQTSLAAFYCALVTIPIVSRPGTAWIWATAWIAGYHVLHAGYVLGWRIRGRPVPLIEVGTPLLDISCVTAGWVALGDPNSALWGIFLYALVGYSRRIHGWAYTGVAVFIAANLAVGRWLMEVASGKSAFDSNLLIGLGLVAAVAGIASAIGSAWRRAERQARQLAEVDPLTGIANRRTFLVRLELIAADPDAEFAVLMLDLDDFKQLNDEFGHLHGDEVLVRVARVLDANLRASDLLARYGGEEFVVAMPDASVGEAGLIADRMRLAVRQTTPTSVSVGCAQREPGEGVEGVIRRADAMLLTAKRHGKNRTYVSEPLRRSA